MKGTRRKPPTAFTRFGETPTSKAACNVHFASPRGWQWPYSRVVAQWGTCRPADTSAASPSVTKQNTRLLGSVAKDMWLFSQNRGPQNQWLPFGFPLRLCQKGSFEKYTPTSCPVSSFEKKLVRRARPALRERHPAARSEHG